LSDRSYTADESYELSNLSTDIFVIAKDSDGFPPTFRWLLSFYSGGFGTNHARLLSAYAGILAIFVVGLAGRAIGGDSVGLGAAIVCAVSAHQIDFSQQCRAYAFCILCVAVAMLACIQVFKTWKWSAWLMFVAACWFALGSHYYAGFFIVFAWLFLLWRPASFPINRWFVSAGVFFVAALAWVACLRFDLAEPIPSEWYNPVDLTGLAYSYFSLAVGWCLGPSSIRLQEISGVEGIAEIAPWAAIGLGCSSIIAYRGYGRLQKPFAIWLVLVIVFTPAVAGFVAASMHSSFVARYIAWLAIPFSILVGAGLTWRGLSVFTMATYLLLGVNLLGTYNRLFDSEYDRENYKELVGYVEHREESPVILSLSLYLGNAIKNEINSDTRFGSVALGSEKDQGSSQTVAELVDGLSDETKVFVITDWLNAGHVLTESRDKWLRALRATPETRISNTVDVFLTTAGECRAWSAANPH
jgi:uncharacterized membrane protein